MTLEEIDWEAEAAADARDEREDYAIRYVTLCITGPRRQVEAETVLLENRMPHGSRCARRASAAVMPARSWG